MGIFGFLDGYKKIETTRLGLFRQHNDKKQKHSEQHKIFSQNKQKGNSKHSCSLMLCTHTDIFIDIF